MKRALVYAFGFYCLILSFSALCEGQVAIGTPQFNDLGGGPFDTVNLGNLNVHFVVPILQKAGRGVSFKYNLTYDGAIWQPATSGSTTSWMNISNTAWGWTSSIPRGGHATALSISSSTEIVPCGPNGLQKPETTTTFSNWVYFDGFGTPHPFAPSSQSMSGCTSSSSGFALATASDGSGYRMSAKGANVTGLEAADGANINPVTGAVTLQDSNGNEITSTTSSGTTTYTDSLGSTVLTISGSGSPSSPTILQYTSPSGSAAKYTVEYTSYTVKTNFGLSGISEYGPTANSLVSSIQLPDGTSYSITYEQTPGSCTPLSGTFAHCITGRIASLTLATGGTVTYLYSGGPSNTGIFADGSTAGLTRILTASTTCSASTSCWQYSRALISGTPGPGSTWTTTVVDPNGNNTVVNFAEDSSTTASTFNLYETQRKAYQGSVSTTACSSATTNNCLLLSSFTCYKANFTNCATATVASPISQIDRYTQLPNGSTRLSETTYNSTGQVTDDREYDYGVTTGAAPGTSHLIKETIFNYGSFNGSGCTALGNNIIGKLCQVIVQDWKSGSAVTLAHTTYAYDQGTLTSTSGTPQHLAISGSRGNLTTLTTQTTATANISKTFTYFDTGTPNVVSELDSDNTTRAQTSYVYGTGSCGNSFPTSINEPMSLSRSTVWNCTGGVATQVTDENGNNVTSAYSDPDFWRPASTTDQISNQTNISYFGQTAIESALQNFNAGKSASDRRTTLDGFGRPILTQRLQAPAATNYDTTETDYNNIGLPQRTTMPFSATAGTTNSSAPGTTRTYDALGRVLTITDAGGGTVSYTYTNNDILQKVSGTQTFQKQFEYDGLGRLTSVCEIISASGNGTCGQTNSQTGYWTKYTYDALGHLLTVTQNAQAASGNQQTRSFVYDFMGRMTSETNPESGTTTYIYGGPSGFTDNCYPGGFADTGDLHQRTDANGNYACYIYDSLHRLTDVGNNIQNTTDPCKRFRFDSASNGLNPPPSGYLSSPNAAGRLIEAATNCNGSNSNVITDEWFAYDKDGRLTDVWESTPNSAGYYHTSQTYFANGVPNTLTGLLASGSSYVPQQTYGVDGEGRWDTVSAASSPNPVTSVSYNTASQITGITFGSTDTDTFAYDGNTNRMTKYTFTVNGSSDVGTLTWNTNGTLATLAISDQLNSADTQTCNYSYDDLARLASVNCGTGIWEQIFTYDSFGNITKSVPSGATGINWQPGYNQANNRYALSGTSYDAAGNLTNDTFRSYTWNVYGRPAAIGTKMMTYDALNRMVEKDDSGTFTQFVYSPSGKLLAHMSGQSATSVRVPLPGSWAVYGSSNTFNHYEHLDWLGNTRLSSFQNRSVTSDIAYAPFGEPYASTATSGVSFTGMRSDVAGVSGGVTSGLYDFPARELPPTQGRWLSPDPLGVGAIKLTNPQSLNRYAYVNNPLRLVDPLGMDGGCPEGDGCDDADNIFQSDGTEGGGGSYSGTDLGSATGAGPSDSNFTIIGANGSTAAVYDGNVYSGSTGALVSNDAAQWLAGGPNDAPLINEDSQIFALVGGVTSLSDAAASLLDGGTSAATSGGASSGFQGFVGSLSNPLEDAYVVGQNAPEVIDGTFYTGHALDTMQQYGIPTSVVNDALTNGTMGFGNQIMTFTFTTENVTVVTNAGGGVITVIPQ